MCAFVVGVVAFGAHAITATAIASANTHNGQPVDRERVVLDVFDILVSAFGWSEWCLGGSEVCAKWKCWFVSLSVRTSYEEFVYI